MNVSDLKEQFPDLEIVRWNRLFKSNRRNKKPTLKMALGEYASIENCRLDGQSTYSIPAQRIVTYDREYVINKLKQDLGLLLIGEKEVFLNLMSEIWEAKQRSKAGNDGKEQV